MCLIIAPGVDGKVALLPREVFDFAYRRNQDGFGAMWVEDGRVKHIKHLELTADEEYALMEQLVEEHPDVIFHMRLKTHGRVIPSLCHPFRVLSKNRHGRDLFFMHNGVLSGYGNALTYGQSDTTAFKDKLLIPLLTRNPDALDDPATWETINKITAGSRLIFLDSDGKVLRTSNTWNSRYGLTLSNTYMLPGVEITRPTGKLVEIPSEDDTKVYGIGSTRSYDERMRGEASYSIYRMLSSGGGAQKYGSWFKEIVPGLIRSEYGSLYYDRGVNVVLNFEKDHISKNEELNVIMDFTPGVERQNTYVPATDDLNDDVPWVDEDKAVPSPVEERLRYARVVHNCHDGDIVSRPNMLADVLSMGTKEMASFIKDDPENANVIMSELVEMVLEYNDLLSNDPTCEDMVFSYDELTELGSSEHHQASMKMISDQRKEKYARLAEAVAEMEEAKKQEAKEKKAA